MLAWLLAVFVSLNCEKPIPGATRWRLAVRRFPDGHQTGVAYLGILRGGVALSYSQGRRVTLGFKEAVQLGKACGIPVLI